MKKEIWDPFEEMRLFQKDMNKLFSDFSSISMPKKLKMRQPLVDVIDNKNQIKVIAEMPGLNKNDIKVTVDRNMVEIKAEKKKHSKVDKKNLYKEERHYSGFYKALTLPHPINPNKVKTKFEKGILTLTMPKTKELPKKKRVLKLK